MSQRDEDLRMLRELLEQHADELTEREVVAFADMRLDLQLYGELVADGSVRKKYEQLTVDQRAWVQSVHRRIVPQYENLVSSGRVPIGKEVPTPAVLKNLPKKPPARRKDGD